MAFYGAHGAVPVAAGDAAAAAEAFAAFTARYADAENPVQEMQKELAERQRLGHGLPFDPAAIAAAYGMHLGSAAVSAPTSDVAKKSVSSWASVASKAPAVGRGVFAGDSDPFKRKYEGSAAAAGPHSSARPGHGAESGDAAAESEEGVEVKTAAAPGAALCSFYLRGSCRNGGACRFRHVDGADEALITFFIVAMERARREDAEAVAAARASGAGAAASVGTGSSSSAAPAGFLAHGPLRDELSPEEIERAIAGGASSAPSAALAEVAAAAAPAPAPAVSAAAADESEFEAAGAAWQSDASRKRDALIAAALETGVASSTAAAEAALQVAEQRLSADVECGICMELVGSASGVTRGKRFGLLTDCTHAFCLDCIRTWRGRVDLPKETVRACPVCRRTSFLVIPCDRYITSDARKAAVAGEYASHASRIRCRYFDGKNGDSCPFGSSCFYGHVTADGSSFVYTRPQLRLDADGGVTVGRPVKLSEFLFRA